MCRKTNESNLTNMIRFASLFNSISNPHGLINAKYIHVEEL